MSSKKVYLSLKVVEYTSLPLSLTILIYVLSGYGMISPIPSILGFTYPIATKVHTLPLLRYLTTLLIALHGYAGTVVLANRCLWRYRIVKELVEVLGILYASVIIAVATIAELLIVLKVHP